MRYSKLFGKTVKDAPSDAVMNSYKLLHQGGFIRESTAGRYFILPLGQRVQNKIISIIKDEMDKEGAQEMLSPVLHPLELWKETNRTNSAGFELMKVKDRRDAEFALGGTAEEMFVDIARKFQMSYKDLPCTIYQFSLKFRDELRARGGLLRVREFIMKDGYSFDVNEEEFIKEYKKMWQTYSKIFERIGLKTIPVEADNGYIGGEYCHEFVVESSVGESKFFITEDGSYAAHEEVATFKKEEKNKGEELKPMEYVDAVRGTTMVDGENIHHKPLWQQIKDVLFVDEKGRYILAVIRGDFDVNETKLMRLTKALSLRHANEEEIRNKIHSEPGFISPVGIKEIIDKDIKLLVVADDSLRTVINMYGGANKLHKDILNINIDRDYKADQEGDIALAKAGYKALNDHELIEKRGIEVGNIFQLGYHYSNLMKDATFMDKDGKPKPYYMGCYGIGVGRTLATIVEKYNDEKGIIWPESVSPFQIHLIGLDLKEESIKSKVEALYKTLQDKNIDVLYDDRDISAGIKFSDADLIGVPYRLVVSKRTGDKVEYKRRDETDAKLLTLEEIMKETS